MILRYMRFGSSAFGTAHSEAVNFANALTTPLMAITESGSIVTVWYWEKTR